MFTSRTLPKLLLPSLKFSSWTSTCGIIPVPMPMPSAPPPRSPSPELVWPTLDNIKDFPFLNVPDSPTYVVTSTPISPAPANNLEVLAHVAAHKLAYWEDKKENLLPVLTQDSFVYQHLGHNPWEYIALEDIPATPLPQAQVTTPVATVPSPTPEPCQPSPALPLVPGVSLADAFPNLFAAPTCTFINDCHPHQYTIIYDCSETFWVLQEEFINRDFLCKIPHIPNLDTYPLHFVTPFCADIFHNIWVNAAAVLPAINLCAKIRHHPHLASFPFGYFKSSFIDSIKFLFGQFPPNWLEYFEGVLVPLVAYDFLDGCITTLCGHLHFTPKGIFVVNRNTCTEDLLYMQPGLAAFVCTPHIPTNLFTCITLSPVETPL